MPFAWLGSSFKVKILSKLCCFEIRLELECRNHFLLKFLDSDLVQNDQSIIVSWYRNSAPMSIRGLLNRILPQNKNLKCDLNQELGHVLQKLFSQQDVNQTFLHPIQKQHILIVWWRNAMNVWRLFFNKGFSLGKSAINIDRV